MTMNASENVRRLRDTVVPGEAFGAKGDDSTNNDTALTAFFQSALARPGVEHRLRPGIYRISTSMPTINVSGVCVRGVGSGIHDVGALFNGAVLKWVGAAGAQMQGIEPNQGPTAQRLANITWEGLAYDGNQLADIGLSIKSVRESRIDVRTANTRVIGLFLGVVATLGEARDLQNNIIFHVGRQIENRTGTVLVCDGDSGANVSLNRIWFEAAHADGPGAILKNVDNNRWEQVRTNCIPGGLATDAVSLLGGATEPLSARSEWFGKVTGNKPIHVYGTGGSTPYPVASQNHLIDLIDVANGTPVPVVEIGGSIRYLTDNGIGTQVVAVGGMVSGDSYAATLDARTRLGTSTLHLVNGSDNHVQLSNLDNSGRWGIRMNGLSLMLDRLAGTGYYMLANIAVPTAADDTAAAALIPPVPVGGLYKTGSAMKIRIA